MTRAVGTSSRTTSSCFGPSSTAIEVTPVMFPPGRARLATRPAATGSPEVTNTIGMVVVAAFAARAGGVPANAAITATLRETRSASSDGNRSWWPSAQRYSMATLRPSTYPLSRRPWRNGRRRSAYKSGDSVPSNPIIGIGACCALAASGHTAAAPPSSVMNWRRFIRSPRRRGRARSRGRRDRAPWRS